MSYTLAYSYLLYCCKNVLLSAKFTPKLHCLTSKTYNLSTTMNLSFHHNPSHDHHHHRVLSLEPLLSKKVGFLEILLGLGFLLVFWCILLVNYYKVKLIIVVIRFLEYKPFSNQHYSKFHHIKYTIKIKLKMIIFATAIKHNCINAHSDASTTVARLMHVPYSL